MISNLWTPWRFSYVVKAKDMKGCIFCEALAGKNDDESLVLFRGRHNFVILNLYPYCNGHLMIAPNEHIARLSEGKPEQSAEMMEIAKEAEQILEKAYKPQGINMGMNLGRCAGEGIVDNHHLHILPRWEGDTNFMTALNQVRVMPEALPETYKRLRPLFEQIDASRLARRCVNDESRDRD